MDNQDKIDAIIGRIIAEGKHTDADLSQLRELFSASDSESLIQFGKNIVGKIYGQDIHTGDRFYKGADSEAIREELRLVLQELRLVLQEKQKADAEAIREALHFFLEELRSVLQKPRAERSPAEQNLRRRVETKIEQDPNYLPHDVTRINLDKEWRQDLVEYPISPETIGKNNNIFDIFTGKKEDIKNQQLLILGEPGAGKTTTMLELAQELLKRVKPQNDYPIPVLLKLSSWKKEQRTMFAWLVYKLEKEYKGGISTEDLKKLLIQDKLLLMLDGLDELEESSRKNCVEAINDLLKKGEIIPGGGEWSPSCIVICSRLQEYETLGFKLQLNRAICLQDLSEAQIQEYLRDRQREEFLQNLQEQDIEKLRDVLQRPLFLKIVCDARQEISIDKLNSFTSLEERQLYLSLSYMRWCLLKKSEDSEIKKWCLLKKWCVPKESEDSKREKKIRLLIWLAKQLQKHGQTEFFIERMQPSWLPPGPSWLPGTWWYLYVVLVALSIILILSLPLLGFIFSARNFTNLNILFYGTFIMGIVVSAVSASLDPKIKVFEDNIVNAIFGTHNINLTNFRQTHVFVILLTVGLLIFLSLSTIPYVVQLICIILFCGLLMVGIARLNGHELQQKTRPNQGIWNSAINAACVAIPIAITVATGFSIKFPLQFLSSLLMIGLPLGLICALLYGGLTCIQHFILRLILFCNGHPWNYAKFLDNAVKVKLLRRVGGRYEFIQSLLKECFAKLHDMYKIK
jgi:DNA polymerase III delta prime subunit